MPILICGVALILAVGGFLTLTHLEEFIERYKATKHDEIEIDDDPWP